MVKGLVICILCILLVLPELDQASLRVDRQIVLQILLHLDKVAKVPGYDLIVCFKHLDLGLRISDSSSVGLELLLEPVDLARQSIKLFTPVLNVIKRIKVEGCRYVVIIDDLV